ncbi:pentapeptide repeat-containing protein, partial [Nonomuraea sp. NPDC050663]|uniref:pentapeptide repeat-containing protein n=1 Tax=Nonomuraea sp. NPDC050663 TaxID=3364370 RepID=UPI0037892647
PPRASASPSCPSHSGYSERSNHDRDHSVRSSKYNRHDATERRVTDLYTKAVEQLGHSAAAVRLGGLYALERVAQDNPAHRQTIVNVICAYLRMDYDSPVQAADDAGTTAAINPADRAELHVRLTAQSILADHLRAKRTSGSPALPDRTDRYWEGMRIDLSGATLVDLDLSYCHIAEARFSGATFVGPASFSRATFDGSANFSGASFNYTATLERASFAGNANFHNVHFSESAAFARALFARRAGFYNTVFTGRGGFAGTKFAGENDFNMATFAQLGVFSDSRFGGPVEFGHASFHHGVTFNDALIEGIADFVGVSFGRRASFFRTTFTESVNFSDARFAGPARFGETSFVYVADVHGATASPSEDHQWPAEWHLVVDSKGCGRLKSPSDDLVVNNPDGPPGHFKRAARPRS